MVFIIKIALIGIAAAFLAMMLKKEKGEYAMLVALVAGVIIFFYAVAQVSFIAGFAEEVLGLLPVDDGYVVQLFKMLGIAYVAEFSSNICKDAGYSSVAGGVEMFAKLAILVLGIPGLTYILDIMENFI